MKTIYKLNNFSKCLPHHHHNIKERLKFLSHQRKKFCEIFFFNFGKIVEWERRDYWVVASDQKVKPLKIHKQVK